MVSVHKKKSCRKNTMISKAGLTLKIYPVLLDFTELCFRTDRVLLEVVHGTDYSCDVFLPPAWQATAKACLAVASVWRGILGENKV